MERIERTIRITANEVLGARSLQGLSAAFIAVHPMFEIEFGISNEITNPLQPDADLAIGISRPTQNDLVARKDRDVLLGLFARAHNFERRSKPRTLDALKFASGRTAIRY